MIACPSLRAQARLERTLAFTPAASDGAPPRHERSFRRRTRFHVRTGLSAHPPAVSLCAESATLADGRKATARRMQRAVLRRATPLQTSCKRFGASLQTFRKRQTTEQPRTRAKAVPRRPVSTGLFASVRGRSQNVTQSGRPVQVPVDTGFSGGLQTFASVRPASARGIGPARPAVCHREARLAARTPRGPLASSVIDVARCAGRLDIGRRVLGRCPSAPIAGVGCRAC
jgi:hypothetical protein